MQRGWVLPAGAASGATAMHSRSFSGFVVWVCNPTRARRGDEDALGLQQLTRARVGRFPSVDQERLEMFMSNSQRVAERPQRLGDFL